MNKQEITFTNEDPKNAQIKTLLFPKDKINSRKTKKANTLTNDIDIIELCITDIEKRDFRVQMTPDEALEICSLLNSTVAFYLNNFSEEYKEKIDKKRKQVVKINSKI